MPIIAPDSLETSLRHAKIDPIYFLFGDEEFLIDESLEQIISATVDESTRSFNFDVLYGSEATFNDIVERASAYPLMAERRVVIVKEIDRLFALRGRSDAAALLTRYVEHPLESTILVMTATASDFLTKGKAGPSGKGGYKALIEHGTSVQFKKIYDRELPSWTAQRIKARGKAITPEAVELFVGYAGSSLRILNNEIEKVFTFVEDRKQITIDDIRAVVGASKTYNIFELQKAIGTKNLELSVNICERMLRAGEPEQLILTMLTRYFTTLWRLQELRQNTDNQQEMARAVGISSFFLNEYLAALSRYPMTHLRNAFEVLLQADLTLKSSNVAATTVLHLLLISIIQGKALTYEPTIH